MKRQSRGLSDLSAGTETVAVLCMSAKSPFCRKEVWLLSAFKWVPFG